MKEIVSRFYIVYRKITKKLDERYRFSIQSNLRAFSLNRMTNHTLEQHRSAIVYFKRRRSVNIITLFFKQQACSATYSGFRKTFSVFLNIIYDGRVHLRVVRMIITRGMFPFHSLLYNHFRKKV